MSDAFINSCKAALTNLISADRLSEAVDPYVAFSNGILNFYAHYCLDDHSSSECYHDKVGKITIIVIAYTFLSLYNALTHTGEGWYAISCEKWFHMQSTV